MRDKLDLGELDHLPGLCPSALLPSTDLTSTRPASKTHPWSCELDILVEKRFILS